MNTPLFLNNIRIVLSHTSHPGNIGSAARAMKTMGLADLRLINPQRFPDPQAHAMAAGASDILDAAQVSDTLEAALAGTVMAVGCTARRRDLSHRMLSAREAAPILMEQAAQTPVALVFGTEMSGLTNAELDRCQMLVHIPADPEFSSLNLGAAVQVLAYELRCALPEQTMPVEAQTTLARHEDLELFYTELERTLLLTGYLNPAAPRRLMPRLRRLFARTMLEKEELNILMGMLKVMRQGYTKG